MIDFAYEEFNEISNSLRKGKYNLELVLRVNNLKSQAPLRRQSGQTWEVVLETINEALEEAEETEDICAPIASLCEIGGLSVPTASALLAAKYPDRFAIIDGKMFEFFRQENAYECIKNIFKIHSDDYRLKRCVEEVKKAFDETASGGWEGIHRQIYPLYLEVLCIIQDIASLSNLREVEWRIWKRADPNSA